MSFKIFRNSFTVALCVLLLSAAMFVGILYRYYEDEAYSELSAEAQCIVQGENAAGSSYFDSFDPTDRVTWVAADGTVLYDSRADAAAMENHLGREEISEALETGTGESAHYSKTLLQKTLYYALLAGDGTVVRVSCVQRSVGSILWGIIQPILWVLLLAVVISGVLSSRMAKKIIKPLNALNIDAPELGGEYPELSPLIGRLREQNLTIRRQMDELSAKQREFSAITDNMNEGFLLVDNKDVILSANQSALDLMFPGHTGAVRSLRQTECPEMLLECVDSAVAGRRAERGFSSGERSFRMIASPVVSSGQVTGTVVMIIDNTENEQRETLRREFSANVSHELKTPLTSISGFAELMKEGLVEPDKMREFSGDIYKESRRLISLVDDIIKLSRLDEDSPAFEKETVDLYELAESLTDSLRNVAAKRGITISLEGDHAEVFGVKQILSEMIYNLCDNAVKYNKDGGSVKVTVAENGGETRFTVADTGIGIPHADQSRVFERFYRVDKSHSRDIGGTGLGLSIVKHGAQYHGARIEMKSEPGRGTAVTIIF